MGLNKSSVFLKKYHECVIHGVGKKCGVFSKDPGHGLKLLVDRYVFLSKFKLTTTGVIVRTSVNDTW